LGNKLKVAGKSFIEHSVNMKYSYNFEWLGRPIIQYPQDIQMIQELIWSIKPDLIIETGIAHGGSLVLSASLLALLDYCDSLERAENLEILKPKRNVIGIDIDIRPDNLKKILAHPMSHRIKMFEGSSISSEIFDKVSLISKDYKKIMVFLDSNHTHEHVLNELKLYAPLVTIGSYCVVFDTVIEDLSKDSIGNRNWGPGNSPKSAVFEYMKNNNNFIIDNAIDDKLVISVAPSGYLKRIS